MDLQSLIERVCRVVPPLIEAGFPRFMVPRRCVLATRVGVEVLRHFGFGPPGVEAVEVKVEAANAAYFKYMPLLKAGKATEAEAKVAGCKIVETDTEGETNASGYRGHLVIGVRPLNALVDLDVGQFARPEVRLILPQDHGIVLHVPPGWWGWRAGAAYELPEGGKIAYRRLVNPPPYEGAGDWRKPQNYTRFVRKAIRLLEQDPP